MAMRASLSEGFGPHWSLDSAAFTGPTFEFEEQHGLGE
jgi:hypothetical protein